MCSRGTTQALLSLRSLKVTSLELQYFEIFLIEHEKWLFSFYKSSFKTGLVLLGEMGPGHWLQDVWKLERHTGYLRAGL